MAHPILLATFLFVPLIIIYYYFSRPQKHSPPGPPGLPLVGNLRDLPSPGERGWLVYDRLCREYNTDVLRLNVFGTNIIVISSLQAATELLDKRSSIYSDRPRMLMLNELAGFGWNFGSMDYNDDWRVCRKMTHQEFHATTFKKYRPVLIKHAYNLVRRLAGEQGARLHAHLKHMVGANIMEITYDLKVQPEHDPFIELAEAAQECVGRAASGTYLVDMLPFLRRVPTWFPGANFKRDAEVWHRAAEKQLHVAYDDFLKRLNAGKVDECMARSLMDEFGTDAQTDRHARMTTATMYMAGSETVAAGMHSLILMLLLRPDIKERARHELEEVIGTGKLPTFDDIGTVPYIDALIMELFRQYPIVPLDLPHKLRTDDVYNGHVLEKDSLILVNIWSILHDPKAYPDPHAFNPDRFLSADGTLSRAGLDPLDVIFGFGRRVCPGRHMALDAMWISAACVLVCLDFAPAKDGAGRPVDVKEDFTTGFVLEPKPFRCEVHFRTEAHAALLDGAL